MPPRKGEIGEFISVLLIFIGALLIGTAGTLRFFVSDRLNALPLNIDTTDTAQSVDESGQAGNYSAQILDRCTTVKGASRARILTANISNQQRTVVVKPSSDSTVTFQVGSALVIDGQKTARGKQSTPTINNVQLGQKMCNDGVLSAFVDTVTLNRKTATPDKQTGAVSAISEDPSRAGVTISDREGFNYHFPVGAGKTGPNGRPFLYFDPITKQSSPLTFQGTATINGVNTYHFSQKIPLKDLSKQLNDAGTIVPGTVLVKPLGWFGIEGSDLPSSTNLTMDLYAEVTRELWVNPETGVIIKQVHNDYKYYQIPPDHKVNSKTANNFRLTSFNATLATTAQSNAAAAKYAKSLITRFTIAQVIAPLALLLSGLAVLIIGAWLLLREIRWRRSIDDFINEHYFDSFDEDELAVEPEI